MGDIRVETEGKVAVVTLARPPVNALTMAAYEELAEIFEVLGKDMAVHCAILTAEGTRAFCAGKDLHEFLAAKVEDDPAQAKIVRRAFSAIYHCEIPVIAAVNGVALGAGAVLAAVCDIRLASETASFGLPEVNIGRCGGGAHVGRLVPQGMLRRMFFTARPIGAAEAHRVGFVDEVHAPDALMAAAREMAAHIATKAPLGLRVGKRSLNEIESLPMEEGYLREQGYSTQLMHTDDAREATRAVVEKRTPVFHGR